MTASSQQDTESRRSRPISNGVDFSDSWQRIKARLLHRTHVPQADRLEYLPGAFSTSDKTIVAILGGLIVLSLVWIFSDINQHFMVAVPVRGGELTEGVVGSVRFVNPLLAISDADKDLSALVYSGLMRELPNGSLVPDLAESYTISPDGLTYTFIIRADALFHDGTPVTADDVVFTVKRAEDPALKSPKLANWDSVDVAAVDAHTVRFTLKQPYEPFIENATLGILPAHLWSGVSVDEMPFSTLNLNPIGTGPFKIEHVKENSSGIPSSFTLVPFERSTRGAAYLARIIIKLYPNTDAATIALVHNDIEALHSVNPATLATSTLNKHAVETAVLSRVFAVFFNQNKNDAFADVHVRQALDTAIDKDAVVKEVLGGYGMVAAGPLPPKEVTATPQASQDENQRLTHAQAFLTAGGWKQDATTKNWTKKSGKTTKTLSVTLATASVPELKRVAEMVQADWQQLGVPVTLEIYDQNDLNQNVIRPREYQALLFGLSVGTEPDLFAFWHSSQRNDPGLNIALYTNITADKLLEQARTTSENTERASLADKIEKVIAADTPASFLYSPEFVYIVPTSLKGISLHQVDMPSDRFEDVSSWYIYTENVWKLFARN